MSSLVFPSPGAAATLHDSGDTRRWTAALLLALLLEAAMLGGGLWLANRPRPPRPLPPLQITLVPPAVSRPAPKPAPKPPEVPKPRPTHPSRPLPRPLVRHVVRHEVPRPAPVVRPLVQAPAPTPVPVHSSIAPPAPPPQPPQPSAQQVASARDTFEAELRAAIQDAVRYPPAARMMDLSGKTLVGFDYLDGKVSNPAVLQSSGSAELDQAAVRAVRQAYCPPPPALLAGRNLHYSIWVRFVLQSS